MIWAQQGDVNDGLFFQACVCQRTDGEVCWWVFYDRPRLSLRRGSSGAAWPLPTSLPSLPSAKQPVSTSTLVLNIHINYQLWCPLAWEFIVHEERKKEWAPLSDIPGWWQEGNPPIQKFSTNYQSGLKDQLAKQGSLRRWSLNWSRFVYQLRGKRMPMRI